MMARPRDMDSAGRMLRVLRDCKLFHMEAAIAKLEHVDAGIRFESLRTPNREDDADRLEGNDAGLRVLSLLDHKQIAQLIAALNSVVNAYNTQEIEEEEGAGGTNLNRNLVCTVAGAAMMQSLKGCTASRTNCCVWGAQAKKVHLLLDWMVERESSEASMNRDYLRQLLLGRVQPVAEKQDQLTACLTIFELLQQRRHKLQTYARGTAIPCLFGDRAGMYLSALRAIVDRGTIQVVGSRHVKPSKLALIALEALALLSGDVAVRYMTSDQVAKKILVEKGLMLETAECIRCVLAALRQWHLHSKHHPFLVYALQHLQSYAIPCCVILSGIEGATSEAAHDTSVNITAILDVLCWHWIAAVPLLCTRSTASCRIRETRPSETLTSVLQKWAFSFLEPKKVRGDNNAITNPEVIYAQLCYVCVLMDSIGRVKGHSKTYDEIAEETKAHFVFFFTQGLSVAVKRGDGGTALFVLKILRTALLSKAAQHMLSSQDDKQEFLSQLLHIHGNFSTSRRISDIMLQCQVELEFFVADFVIFREVFVTEILRRLQHAYTNSDKSILSFVRTLLYRLDKATPQTKLHKHWRKLLTPEIVRFAAQGNCDTHRFALSCLPSLDVVACVAELCGPNLCGAKSHLVTSTLGYLFAASSRDSIEAMVSWFIDACQFGSTQVHSVSDTIPLSPHDWNSSVMQPNESVGDETQEMRNELFSLCFGPNGWTKHVLSASIRCDVLRLSIQKVFSFPRSAVLLQMLREFVLCDWVDNELFNMIGKRITAQMMNLPRLTEEHLNDNSFSAVTSIRGLLFSRLAPLLILRMVPRDVLGNTCAKLLPCGREDLHHLNACIEDELKTASNESEVSCVDQESFISKTLFHVLARSMVDPLEFKEVKMVATECLSKFPPPRVLPFVLAYLVAFLREEIVCDAGFSSPVVAEESIPDSCGLVTAKLMVFYLNRVFSEDSNAFRDDDVVSKALVVLVHVLEIPCTQISKTGSASPPSTDIQRGCIDCIALILLRLSGIDDGQRSKGVPTINASSLVDLLMEWAFDKAARKDVVHHDADTFTSRVQEMLCSMRRGGYPHRLSLQARICICNVFLSAISRAGNEVLANWKSQRIIARIALATGCCTEDDIVAGGFQIIFAFLYKSSEVISMEDKDDVRFLHIIFDATATCLKTTDCECIAMNGLKVIGTVIGKFPGFVGMLAPIELQHLIDGCLTKLHDRQLLPAVTKLAHALLQAMTPP
uniref:Uncharacterized protein n=1 Tax=Peronospora matthiolae TaxID=2874970 RepID=A0AAV1V2S7_9STRA